VFYEEKKKTVAKNSKWPSQTFFPELVAAIHPPWTKCAADLN
jgi:hypothetical protein